MTTPIETTLAVIPANSATAAQVGFVDRSGGAGASLAPMHAPINTLGNRVDPATSEDIASIVAAVLKVATQANAPRVSATGTLAAAYNASVSVAANVTAGAALLLAVDGMATAVAQVAGAWVGTIVFSGSIDGGATFFPMNVTPMGAPGGAAVSTTSANGQFEFSASGYTHVLLEMIAFTSGSAAVLLAAANGAKIARVKAPASDPLPVTQAAASVFAQDFNAQSIAAGGGQLTTNARVAGPSPSAYVRFTATIQLSQAGQAKVQGSLDNFATTAFDVTPPTTIAANGFATFSVAIEYPYYHVVVTNTSGSAGTATVSSGLHVA